MSRRIGAGTLRRPGFRGLGGGGGGGGAYSGPLLDVAASQFARTTEGSYLTAADAMSWATAGTRRVDSGTFGEALTLIERASKNQAIYSEDYSQATWTKVSASLGSAVAAPDGDVDAYPVVFTASANARLNLAMTSTDMPNGTIVSASRWVQADSGGGVSRLDIVRRDGVTSGTLVDYTATASWTQDRRRGFSVGTGASNVQARHRNGSGGAATTVRCWGMQVELGYYETSYIRNTSNVQTSRVADTWTWLSAEVPLALREGAARMRCAPRWVDTDLQASEERWLLSIGGANDGIRVRNDAGTRKLEAVAGGVVVATLTISSLVRYAPVWVSWDPVAATVTWDGSTSSAGTPWTWPSDGCRVGGIMGGSSEWDGGVLVPETLS